jgi:transcriptional repressor NrdR
MKSFEKHKKRKIVLIIFILLILFVVGIYGSIIWTLHKGMVDIVERDEIEKEIFDREEKEISSSEIGELVIKRVHSLDPVAYVRFASVYREFKDVGTFMDELGKLLEQENTRGKKKS